MPSCSRRPVTLPRIHTAHGSGNRGFTLVELITAIAVLGILAAIAIPAYSQYLAKSRITLAIFGIRQLEVSINAYRNDHLALPDSLSALAAFTPLTDPWGHPYVYLKIEGSGIKGKGSFRKDRFLNPLNSDYDLYSMGPDGASQMPLTAKTSRDDIVRANNGGFVGAVTDFDP